MCAHPPTHTHTHTQTQVTPAPPDPQHHSRHVTFRALSNTDNGCTHPSALNSGACVPKSSAQSNQPTFILLTPARQKVHAGSYFRAEQLCDVDTVCNQRARLRTLPVAPFTHTSTPKVHCEPLTQRRVSVEEKFQSGFSAERRVTPRQPLSRFGSGNFCCIPAQTSGW